MKYKYPLAICLVFSLAGCFRVGRLPATTSSGPGYDDPKSAVLIPQGTGTTILTVNGEMVRTDFFDRLANLGLNIFLMYLEPQVYVRPGENVLGVRGSESSTAIYGTYKTTTTTWRDYAMKLNAEAAQRYFVRASVYGGVEIAEDRSAPPKNSSVASNVPAADEAPQKPAAKTPVKKAANLKLARKQK